jgi:hypothetical protein
MGRLFPLGLRTIWREPEQVVTCALTRPHGKSESAVDPLGDCEEPFGLVESLRVGDGQE